MRIIVNPRMASIYPIRLFIIKTVRRYEKMMKMPNLRWHNFFSQHGNQLAELLLLTLSITLEVNHDSPIDGYQLRDS